MSLARFIISTASPESLRLALNLCQCQRAQSSQHYFVSVASIPLKVRTRADGARVESPPKVINQPDPRVPGSATYAWLAEDLLYGYGYLKILEIYADTYRIRSAERIDPTRVTIKTNAQGTEIEYYCVDSIPVPYEGVGSSCSVLRKR
jgi:hypothetical protein